MLRIKKSISYLLISVYCFYIYIYMCGFYLPHKNRDLTVLYMKESLTNLQHKICNNIQSPFFLSLRKHNKVRKKKKSSQHWHIFFTHVLFPSLFFIHFLQTHPFLQRLTTDAVNVLWALFIWFSTTVAANVEREKNITGRGKRGR